MDKYKEIVNKLSNALNEAEKDKIDISNLVLIYKLNNSTIKIFHMGEVNNSIGLLEEVKEIMEKDVEEIMESFNSEIKN